VEFDIYPYQAGSTVLTQLLPQWALDGGNSSMLARLSDREQRRRIAEETRQNLAQEWSDILISAVETAGNQPLVGQTVAAIAGARGTDPAETVIDLLLEESGAVNMVSFNQSEENLRELLAHPLASVISDSFYVKGRPHPRLYGTFPQLLGYCCRRRHWMPLAEAIHKITAKPAARLRLKDRGLLRPGAVADITVFDEQTVASDASYEDPERRPVGIRAVFRG
jgi:dihydroorotase/N-acyl-D-amino-acid deacylase